MANKKTLVAITTFNREESFWKVYNSINLNQVDILVIQDGREFQPYSEDFHKIEDAVIITHDDQGGIARSKKQATEYAIENNYEHLFLVEDDTLIKSNKVWAFCKKFSKFTGLKHFNWNEAQPNQLKTDITISGHEVQIHRDVQGSFSYFHKDIFDQYSWDANYVNAYEHVDVEYQLALKKLIPPFWNFVSPKGLNEYLENIDQPSTITGVDTGEGFNYNQNLTNAVIHWQGKWGNRPHRTQIKDVGLERTELRLKKIQERYGVPDEVVEKEVKPNPVSVVVCIKDRCHIKYNSVEELLPEELRLMQQHDKIMMKVAKAQEGMGGILLNQQLINNPEGFRPFDHFLKSLNEQAHKFKGVVELVVVDYSSKDDDVEELIELFWDHETNYVSIPYEEQFSRGFSLHKGIGVAKYERLCISDVDMVYTSPRPLEECSELEVGEGAIFPQILKEHSPSSLFMFVETAGFGIASFTKTDYFKTRGYPDIRKWGKEDHEVFVEFVELLGRDKIKRTLYRDLYHSWHSNKHRSN